MLALGGRAFTKGLAERFGIAFDRAEALKLAVATGHEAPDGLGGEPAASVLEEDALVWRAGIELMIADLAGGELLPGRVLLCGGGADLPQIGSILDRDDWWRRLPFARRPQVRALAPDEVAGLSDATGALTTRQDVTPMALAHQALILDAQASALDRAMQGAVRALEL
jgi:cell division protein FtsA